MTETELETKLRLTESQLKDAQGKIKAVELNSYEIKRNAQKSVEEANAIKAEMEASLATAAEQLKTAHAIGCGVFGMTNLCRAFMSRKVAASRMVHREAYLMELLQGFLDATNNTKKKVAEEKAKQTIAAVKADGEAARKKLFEYALAYGFKNFEEVFNALVTEENSSV